MAKTELCIDPDFKKLCPPLTKAEYDQLTANILADGCREPLVIWGQIVVDGMNRFEICEKHGKPFKTVTKNFFDDDEAKDWIINNQLGRRNITPKQRDMLIGQLYISRKKHDAEVEQPLDTCSDGQNDQQDSNEVAINAAETIAAEHGVSEKTVRRAADFVEAVEKLTESVRQTILSDEVKATKDDIKRLAELPAAEQVKVVNKAKGGSGKLKDALPPKQERRPKSGAIKFDWHKLDLEIGSVIRKLDDANRAYPHSNCHRACLKHANELLVSIKEWRKAKQ